MNSTMRFAIGSLLALTFVPLGAEARDTGFYLGGSVGQSQVEILGDTELPALPDFTFDEDDTAWKIFGGYNWKFTLLNVGVEGGYVNFGKPSQTFDIVGVPVPVTLAVEPTALNLWGTAGFDLGLLDVYGKLGMVFWDVDFAASAPGVPTESDSDDGNDVGYGIGGRLNFGRLGIRLEYEIYDIEDSEDVSMWSLGAEWRF